MGRPAVHLPQTGRVSDSADKRWPSYIPLLFHALHTTVLLPEVANQAVWSLVFVADDAEESRY